MEKHYIKLRYASSNKMIIIKVHENQFRRLRNMFHDISQNNNTEIPKFLKIKDVFFNTELIELIQFEVREGEWYAKVIYKYHVWHSHDRHCVIGIIGGRSNRIGFIAFNGNSHDIVILSK